MGGRLEIIWQGYLGVSRVIRGIRGRRGIPG